MSIPPMDLRRRRRDQPSAPAGVADSSAQCRDDRRPSSRRTERCVRTLTTKIEVESDDVASSMSNSLSCCLSGRPRWLAPTRNGVKVAAWRGPTHVLQTGPASVDLATFVLRVIPVQAEWWHSAHRGAAWFLPSESLSSPPPRPAGMLMHPRDRRSMVDLSPGVPYTSEGMAVGDIARLFRTPVHVICD